MKLFSRFTHNRLITDALREIRATRSRFLSILVLSALAVCFLAGLRATEPDMKNSADRYLDSLRLMDLRVAATLGLTDEDIALLSEQPGVRLCQGAYTIDAMVKTGEKDSNAKVLSYTEEINCPELLEGRLPQTPEECLAEPRFLQETGLFPSGIPSHWIPAPATMRTPSPAHSSPLQALPIPRSISAWNGARPLWAPARRNISCCCPWSPLPWRAIPMPICWWTARRS